LEIGSISGIRLWGGSRGTREMEINRLRDNRMNPYMNVRNMVGLCTLLTRMKMVIDQIMVKIGMDTSLG